MIITELQLRKIIRNKLLLETAMFPWLIFWGSMKDEESMRDILGSESFFNFLMGASTAMLGTGIAGSGAMYAASAVDLEIAYTHYKNDETLLSALFVLLGVVPFASGMFNKSNGGKALGKALNSEGYETIDDIEDVVHKATARSGPLSSDQKKAADYLSKLSKSTTGIKEFSKTLLPGKKIKFKSWAEYTPDAPTQTATIVGKGTEYITIAPKAYKTNPRGVGKIDAIVDSPSYRALVKGDKSAANKIGYKNENIGEWVHIEGKSSLSGTYNEEHVSIYFQIDGIDQNITLPVSQFKKWVEAAN